MGTIVVVAVVLGSMAACSASVVDDAASTSDSAGGAGGRADSGVAGRAVVAAGAPGMDVDAGAPAVDVGGASSGSPSGGAPELAGGAGQATGGSAGMAGDPGGAGGEAPSGPCDSPAVFQDAVMRDALVYRYQHYDREEDEEEYNPYPGSWRQFIAGVGSIVIGPGVKDPRGIECLTGLQRLTMTDADLDDWTPLAAVTELTELKIQGGSPDLSAFGSFHQLGFLRLDSTEVTELEPLVAALELEKVEISSTPVSDVSALAQLPKLHSMELQDVALTSESELSGFPALTQLFFYNTPLGHLPDLTGLEALLDLYVYGDELVDLNGIGPNVRQIDAYGNPIADLSALQGRAKLTSLYLGNTDGEPKLVADLAVLGSVTQLAVLSLIGVDASDLSFLDDLPVLTSLQIPHSAPLDLESIAKHGGFYSLILSGDGLTDIAALSEVGNVTYLDLSRNQLSDLSPLVSALTGPGQLNVLQNPLNCLAQLPVIQQLRLRGITFETECSLF